MELFIHEYGCLSSTSDVLKSMIIDGAEPGTGIVTRSQTAGRGRRGKTFASPEGGIYISVYYGEDGIDEKNYLKITPAAAVCVYKAIAAVCTDDVKIKWVNDLYVNERKVCGILTERVENGFVVGIGINTAESTIPEELAGIAGCVSAKRDELLHSLCIELCNLKNYVSSHETLNLYREKAYLTGRLVSFTRNGEERSGIAESVDDDFRLVIRVGGRKFTVDSGEVTTLVKR